MSESEELSENCESIYSNYSKEDLLASINTQMTNLTNQKLRQVLIFLTIMNNDEEDSTEEEEEEYDSSELDDLSEEAYMKKITNLATYSESEYNDMVLKLTTTSLPPPPPPSTSSTSTIFSK